MKMESYEEMTERHQAEIDELQARCPHSAITDWMEYSYAPGHTWGQVRVCKHCNKIMDTQNQW